MPQKARIKISSQNLDSIKALEKSILDLVKESNVSFSGPIPLPTRTLKVTTMKNPSGEGTVTWDKFEMRIHRRVFYLDANEKALRMLLRVKLPEDAKVSLDLF
jgi:small subunit ribosomal protein S10